MPSEVPTGVPGTQSIGVYGGTWGAVRCRKIVKGFRSWTRSQAPVVTGFQTVRCT